MERQTRGCDRWVNDHSCFARTDVVSVGPQDSPRAIQGDGDDGQARENCEMETSAFERTDLPVAAPVAFREKDHRGACPYLRCRLLKALHRVAGTIAVHGNVPGTTEVPTHE